MLVTPLHTDLMLKRSVIFKKVCKGPLSATLSKILRLNITLTGKFVQNTKIFVQTNAERKFEQKSFINQCVPI